MVERLNGELRRRDRVIRIYPNAASAIRLMGAQLVEHDEKWETNGKYLDMLEYQSGGPLVGPPMSLRLLPSRKLVRDAFYTTFGT